MWASASSPTVSAVSIVSSIYISFTGTNFITSGFTGKARFGGVYADSVTINSASDCVATFSKGVPYISGTAVKPELLFVSTSSTESHWAIVSATLNNQPPTLSPDAATCSFAGGCLYSIDGQGLSSTLSNSTRA